MKKRKKKQLPIEVTSEVTHHLRFTREHLREALITAAMDYLQLTLPDEGKGPTVFDVGSVDFLVDDITQEVTGCEVHIQERAE